MPLQAGTSLGPYQIDAPRRMNFPQQPYRRVVDEGSEFARPGR